MRIVALAVLGLAFAAAAGAQVQSPRASILITGAVSPEVMTERLDASVTSQQANYPPGTTASRVVQTDIGWGKNAEEHKLLGRNAILLVVAVSQTEAELPLKRVYVRSSNGDETLLEKLGSERRAVQPGSPTASFFGRYREDSFYLAPAELLNSSGYLAVDFAINRSGFLPFPLPTKMPEFAKADLTAAVRPDPDTLNAVLAREYPGFALSGDSPVRQ